MLPRTDEQELTEKGLNHLHPSSNINLFGAYRDEVVLPFSPTGVQLDVSAVKRTGDKNVSHEEGGGGQSNVRRANFSFSVQHQQSLITEITDSLLKGGCTCISTSRNVSVGLVICSLGGYKG